MKHQLRNEIIWLVSILATSLLLAFIYLGKNPFSDTIDIHLKDTFYILKPLHVLAPFYLLLTAIIYVLKEAFHGYKRAIPKAILITSITIAILYVGLLMSNLP